MEQNGSLAVVETASTNRSFDKYLDDQVLIVESHAQARVDECQWSEARGVQLGAVGAFVSLCFAPPMTIAAIAMGGALVMKGKVQRQAMLSRTSIREMIFKDYRSKDDDDIAPIKADTLYAYMNNHERAIHCLCCRGPLRDVIKRMCSGRDEIESAQVLEKGLEILEDVHDSYLDNPNIPKAAMAEFVEIFQDELESFTGLAAPVPALPAPVSEVPTGMGSPMAKLKALKSAGLDLLPLVKRPLVIHNGESQSGKSTIAHMVNVVRDVLGFDSFYTSTDDDVKDTGAKNLGIGSPEVAAPVVLEWQDKIANATKGSLGWCSLTIDEALRLNEYQDGIFQSFVKTVLAKGTKANIAVSLITQSFTMESLGIKGANKAIQEKMVLIEPIAKHDEFGEASPSGTYFVTSCKADESGTKRMVKERMEIPKFLLAPDANGIVDPVKALKDWLTADLNSDRVSVESVESLVTTGSTAITVEAEVVPDNTCSTVTIERDNNGFNSSLTDVQQLVLGAMRRESKPVSKRYFILRKHGISHAPNGKDDVMPQLIEPMLDANVIEAVSVGGYTKYQAIL